MQNFCCMDAIDKPLISKNNALHHIHGKLQKIVNILSIIVDMIESRDMNWTNIFHHWKCCCSKFCQCIPDLHLLEALLYPGGWIIHDHPPLGTSVHVLRLLLNLQLSTDPKYNYVINNHHLHLYIVIVVSCSSCRHLVVAAPEEEQNFLKTHPKIWDQVWLLVWLLMAYNVSHGRSKQRPCQ